MGSSGHMVCERTVGFRMPSITQFCWLWRPEIKSGGPYPEALPLARMLNLSQNPLLHLSSFVSIHRPSFPLWPPAWLWRDRGGLWAGPKRKGRGGAKDILRSRSRRPTGSATDMLVPAPWNEDKTQLMSWVSRKPLQVFQKSGSGWSKKGYTFMVGSGMSGMMEARTSKILYSLPSSNFPRKPNSYLTLWFPHIVSLFGEE